MWHMFHFYFVINYRISPHTEGMFIYLFVCLFGSFSSVRPTVCVMYAD